MIENARNCGNKSCNICGPNFDKIKEEIRTLLINYQCSFSDCVGIFAKLLANTFVSQQKSTHDEIEKFKIYKMFFDIIEYLYANVLADKEKHNLH